MNDRKKDLLLHLYGEAPPDSRLRDLLEDEELHDEYQALSRVKFRLDHRKPVRPDVQVIDALLADVGGEDSPPGQRRGDRPGIARARLRRLLIPALSIAAALVLAFALGWWVRMPAIETAPTTAFDADMPVPPESLHRVVPPTGSTGLASSTNDPLLAWDEPERLEMWHRRIESLESASESGIWGDAPVPLEMMPGSSNRPSGFIPAGADNRSKEQN